jgi:hypothetical protein
MRFWILALIAAGASIGLLQAAETPPPQPQEISDGGMAQAPAAAGGAAPFTYGGVVIFRGTPDAGDTSTLSGAGPTVGTGPQVGTGPEVSAGPQVGPPDSARATDAGLRY